MFLSSLIAHSILVILTLMVNMKETCSRAKRLVKALDGMNGRSRPPTEPGARAQPRQSRPGRRSTRIPGVQRSPRCSQPCAPVDLGDEFPDRAAA
jgi:hypothetical protein